MIPKDEQPYKIPDNWRWIRLKEVCDGFQYGYTEKATFEKIGPNFIRITDIRNGIIHDETAPYCKISDSEYLKYKINKDDILIARMGSVGENGFAKHDIDGVFASYLIRLIPKILPEFVRDYLQSDLYWNQIMDNSQGTTRLNVNANILKSLIFPLPPLDEQQRIVDIIESLFAKLDKAKTLAQNVVDNYELRRLAILHKAFTGQLTKCDFKRMTINSICKSLTYGTSKKSSKSGKTIVIRMGNLQNGEINWSNLAYSNDDEEIEKYNLSVGDVLFNRTNSAELVGKTSIYRGEYPAIYAGYLIKLDYDHNILIGDYFNYILNSPEAKNYCQIVKTDGVNQSNINAKKIGAFEIPLPNINEQKEIVHILDSLLAKEQRTKELAEQTLQKIDLIKKSILARAFRGELNTKN
ncbi:MAG: restriction endonuclease subunit S [Selenomonadaceae bacterium]|nr:restriction endonuclease subunit S [Selenomonadaceae bacterium]